MVVVLGRSLEALPPPSCKVVRSPYPVSDQCFPVPECQHKCHTEQEQVCQVTQKKKCGIIRDKKCKTVFETECSSYKETGCSTVSDRECTTGIRVSLFACRPTTQPDTMQLCTCGLLTRLGVISAVIDPSTTLLCYSDGGGVLRGGAGGAVRGAAADGGGLSGVIPTGDI